MLNPFSRFARGNLPPETDMGPLTLSAEGALNLFVSMVSLSFAVFTMLTFENRSVTFGEEPLYFKTARSYKRLAFYPTNCKHDFEHCYVLRMNDLSR